MAEMMAFLGAGMGASGGYQAYQQQKEIKSSFCDLLKQMNSYKENSLAIKNNLTSEDIELRNKISDLSFQISGIHDSINMKKAQYNDNYKKLTYYGIIALIIIIFILATKRFVLKE